jgi:hypothetical protein
LSYQGLDGRIGKESATYPAIGSGGAIATGIVGS